MTGYVNDAQLARRLGLTKDELETLTLAGQKSGFPPPDPRAGNKRWFPAVEAWLDKQHHVEANSGVGQPDGKENFT